MSVVYEVGNTGILVLWRVREKLYLGQWSDSAVMLECKGEALFSHAH